MLRLAYCCHDPLPSPAAHTQQMFWTLVEAARHGAGVTLHLRQGREGQEGQEGQERERLEAWYGAPSGYIPDALAIRRHSTVARPEWFAKASFDRRMPSRLAREQFDVVWTRNVMAAYWLTRAGLPTVFETYRPDLATDWRFAWWRAAVLRSPAFCGVVHHSAVADAAFARAGVPADRRIVARNGFAPSWMEPRLDRDSARRALHLPAGRPIVIYAGDLHRAKGIDWLVRLAASAPDALVMLLGADGEARARGIARLARERGADNVRVEPRVTIGRVAPYLYAADCLVVPPPAEPLERSRTVLPIKVFLYMAAGRAILAPRRADVEEVLTDGLTARLVPPEDDGAAARALREVLDDDDLRGRLARSALASSAEHTWAVRAGSILEFLNGRARR